MTGHFKTADRYLSFVRARVSACVHAFPRLRTQDHVCLLMFSQVYFNLLMVALSVSLIFWGMFETVLISLLPVLGKIQKDLMNSVDLRCESVTLPIPRDKRIGPMRGAGVLQGSGSSRSRSDQ
jgi:hypothetical protein